MGLLALILAVAATATGSCTAIRMQQAAKIEEAVGVVPLSQLGGDTRVPMSGPIQIANAFPANLVFDLQAIPTAAKLEILVTGVLAACALPSEPQGRTNLLLNGRDVSSFTLGPSGEGRTYRVVADLEPAVLRVGRNSIVLQGAPCSYGKFEQVRINDVVVRSGR